MRALLTTATIAALIGLGLEPAAWGQQQSSTRNTSNLSVLSGSTGGSSATPSAGSSARSTRGTGGVVQIAPITPFEAGGFVGADIEDVRNAMGATGAERGGGTAGRGQTGRSTASPFGSSSFGRALQSLMTGRGTSYGSRGSTEIRARIRTGFSVARPALQERSSKLAGRLEKSSWLQAQSPMEVSIEGETVVLRGVVATEHDRVLAEQFAKLEPGVRRVENLLTLVPPSESPSTQPPAP